MFYFPDPIGGLNNAVTILDNQISDKKIDIKKLTDYAKQFPSIAVKKRVGFALEQYGISESLLKPLKDCVKKSSLITLYGSKSRKGQIKNKWKVIIDAS